MDRKTKTRHLFFDCQLITAALLSIMTIYVLRVCLFPSNVQYGENIIYVVIIWNMLLSGEKWEKLQTAP